MDLMTGTHQLPQIHIPTHEGFQMLMTVLLASPATCSQRRNRRVSKTQQKEIETKNGCVHYYSNCIITIVENFLYRRNVTLPVNCILSLTSSGLSLEHWKALGLKPQLTVLPTCNAT